MKIIVCSNLLHSHLGDHTDEYAQNSLRIHTQSNLIKVNNLLNILKIWSTIQKMNKQKYYGKNQDSGEHNSFPIPLCNFGLIEVYSSSNGRITACSSCRFRNVCEKSNFDNSVGEPQDFSESENMLQTLCDSSLSVSYSIYFE